MVGRYDLINNDDDALLSPLFSIDWGIIRNYQIGCQTPIRGQNRPGVT